MPSSRPDIAETLAAPSLPGTDAGWALFLDVDGTLLDFADRPNDVEVNSQLRDDLACMRLRLDGALALLSGRPLRQLDDLFDWRGHTAAGLHGAELRLPDGREHFTGDVARFAATRSRAVTLVGAARGIVLEDKQRALALHFRQAPAARATAERIAESLLHDAGPDYALQHGDHVIELKPAAANKGAALAALAALPPFRGRQPWVLGDDLTDEHAFRCVNMLGGVSVIVGGRRPTAARCALAEPAAARAWLHALAATAAA